MLRRSIDPKSKVVAVEYQHKMPLVVSEEKICDYIADFKVSFADGHVEIHDAKGFLTDVYRLKKKLVHAIYGIEIKEF
jgi:hypothetical protein